LNGSSPPFFFVYITNSSHNTLLLALDRNFFEVCLLEFVFPISLVIFQAISFRFPIEDLLYHIMLG
jgi:hypothetical protein